MLVRSNDWPTILEGLLHPGSPAFSVLAKRQTFLNEVLTDGTVQDRAEVLRTFRVPLDQMLDIAVSHELGHAFCMEVSEREADRFAEQLRKAGVAQCNGARKSDSSRYRANAWLRDEPRKFANFCGYEMSHCAGCAGGGHLMPFSFLHWVTFTGLPCMQVVMP